MANHFLRLFLDFQRDGHRRLLWWRHSAILRDQLSEFDVKMEHRSTRNRHQVAVKPNCREFVEKKLIYANDFEGMKCSACLVSTFRHVEADENDQIRSKSERPRSRPTAPTFPSHRHSNQIPRSRTKCCCGRSSFLIRHLTFSIILAQVKIWLVKPEYSWRNTLHFLKKIIVL